jgi:23S rRNA (adenine2503-C2)-methyltransferase
MALRNSNKNIRNYKAIKAKLLAEYQSPTPAADEKTAPATGAEPVRPHFLSLTPADYRGLAAAWGEPRFRGEQLVDWIFKRRVLTTAAMTNLPAALRQRLETALDWTLPEIRSRLTAADGATKLLLASERGLIESVILRYDNRTSLCVSSQVGCKLACSFCQTGKLGFVRHLSDAEILAQFALAGDIVRAEDRRITHVVFMGMGEPLDNYDNVVKAVRQLSGPEAFGLSWRNVTVSTSGIVPKIAALATDVRAALAVSLHASRDELRTELMPINRRWPLAALKEALLSYQKTTGDLVTLEYIMIKDKNCGLREAKELVRFIHGLRAKVNLIPFNAHPGLPYDRPDDETIRTFQKHLAERSIAAPVRYSKGLDVSGACGQLAAKHKDDLTAAPARARLLKVGTAEI